MLKINTPDRIIYIPWPEYTYILKLSLFYPHNVFFFLTKQVFYSEREQDILAITNQPNYKLLKNMELYKAIQRGEDRPVILPTTI